MKGFGMSTKPKTEQRANGTARSDDLMPSGSTLGRSRRLVAGLVLLVLVVLVVLAGGRARRLRLQAARQADGLAAEVQRGPLSISLVETGTIRNRERVIVRSEVEGSRTIIQLVDEGTMVAQGDLLVELDSSALEEQRLEQVARIQNNEAAVIQSRESLAVVRNQATADVARAELDLRFAIMALEQYEAGDFPQQLQQADATITIANEEMQRARDNLEWSRRLEADGYITRSELEADELALKRRQLDLELAISKRDLLTAYTHRQTLEKLNSDIEQSEMALERVQRRARADIIRAEADLRSREFDLQHQQNRLQRLAEQIAKCRITAPSAGMVIYATSVQAHRWRRIDPLEPGQTVRERQELIHLPTTSDMMVEISIQEASLPKLREGMPARITLDTGPERVFRGRLHRIGILPDSTSMALNPDLKLYNCSVYIDDDTGALRQGMSCTVELLVEQHADVLFMPLQSLVRINGQPTVYIAGPRGVEPRTVSIGLDNGRMVHVIDGVDAGERVLLAPPLSESSSPDKPIEAEPIPDDAPMGEGPPVQPAAAQTPAGRPEGGGRGAGRERRPAAGVPGS